MVASYTTNGRITKQGTNDNPNTWGTVFNNQVIELFEESIFGVADVDVTGSSNVLLTTANGATDEARHSTLELTGTLGADIELQIPATEKQYFVRGAWTGAFTVTLKINGSSTSVDIQTGEVKIIYCNGTDTYDMVSVEGFLTIANNLSDLTDVAAARTNLGLGELAVQDDDDILAKVYPVGSIYINATDATNPGTLLGFGTWVAFGSGKVPVGLDSGDADFDTAEETGGAKAHTLTKAQLPSYSISFNALRRTDFNSTGHVIFNGFSGGGATSQSTYTQNISAGGSGEEHPIVQPYIVVHMWKRTA